MISRYVVYPVDADGNETRDCFGCDCRLGFMTEKAARNYALFLSLRFPGFRIEKNQVKYGGVSYDGA